MKKTNIAAGLITCLFATSAIMNDAQAQSWSLNGNTGTTSSNYIGTTDSRSFTIKTAGAKRITVTSGGKVGVGTASPAYRLDVYGGTNTADTVSVIRGLVKKTGNFDIPAITGTSQPAAGYGIGCQGNGNFIGLFGNGGSIGVAGVSSSVGVSGEASLAGSASDLTGTQGICSGGDVGVGVYGTSLSGNANYGVYGDQPDTASGNDYAVVSLGDFFYWRAFAPSDARLKSNIQPYSGALDKISQLNTTTYIFNKAQYPGMRLPSGSQTGFIADQFQRVFPDLIKEGNIPAGGTRDARGNVTYKTIDNIKAVNYIGLIPVLAEAVKEQKQIVDQKDVIIAQQNDRIAKLESQIDQLAAIMQQSGQISVQQKNAIVKGADQAKLYQNQPNPVNGVTTIGYYLPSSVKSASLNVVNAQGVIVKSINLNQQGNGQVTLNAAEFVNGNYTYSLIIDGKVSDSKSILMAK